MIVSLLSSLVVIGCYWAIRGCKDTYTGTSRWRPSRSSEPLLPSCTLPACCSVHSRVLTHGPGKGPGLGLFQLTVLEPEPATQPQTSWQIAGWAGNSGPGAAVHTCLSTSQVPGAAFQGLLQSQLREALEGDGAISLP